MTPMPLWSLCLNSTNSPSLCYLTNLAGIDHSFYCVLPSYAIPVIGATVLPLNPIYSCPSFCQAVSFKKAGLFVEFPYLHLYVPGPLIWL